MNIHTATLPLIFTQQYVSFALVLARLCIVIFYSVLIYMHLPSYSFSFHNISFSILLCFLYIYFYEFVV